MYLCVCVCVFCGPRFVCFGMRKEAHKSERGWTMDGHVHYHPPPWMVRRSICYIYIIKPMHVRVWIHMYIPLHTLIHIRVTCLKILLPSTHSLIHTYTHTASQPTMCQSPKGGGGGGGGSTNASTSTSTHTHTHTHPQSSPPRQRRPRPQTQTETQSSTSIGQRQVCVCVCVCVCV